MGSRGQISEIASCFKRYFQEAVGRSGPRSRSHRNLDRLIAIHYAMGVLYHQKTSLFMQQNTPSYSHAFILPDVRSLLPS